MDVEVNYVAVLLAAFSSMFIGYIWYNPKVFGAKWLKLAKLDPKKTNTALAMGSAALASLVMAYVLAHVSYLSYSFFQDSFFMDTIMTTFWMWAGFQVFRVFQRDQFNQRPLQESLIHIGNDFVTIFAMGIIIGLMGV